MIDNAYWLIGISVLMHVAWNLLARHVDKKANYLWWGLLAHLLILGPYAFWSLLEDSTWSITLVQAILVSASANALYFVALRRAYHFAPVALVYPLARSSPILIAIWTLLWFEADITVQEIIAISVSVLGLWVLAASTRNGDVKNVVLWTFIAALSTSIYSISDKLAVEYLPSFSSQLGFISIGYLVSFLVLTYEQVRETGRWVPAQRPKWIYIIMGGLFIGTAYALVVRAMRDLPAAHVVSFTNAGIVLAVFLSVFVFKEKENWKQRLSGALIVSLGLLLLKWL